eukprot:jgi/Chrzof1/12406/Cz06g33100.t1
MYWLSSAHACPLCVVLLIRLQCSGTPGAVAPEIERRWPGFHTATAEQLLECFMRSDIWAVAAVVVDVMSGTKPRMAVPVSESRDLVLGVCNPRIVPDVLHSTNEKVPIRVQALLTYMLQADPTARPSAAECLAEVQAVMAEIATGRSHDFSNNGGKVDLAFAAQQNLVINELYGNYHKLQQACEQLMWQFTLEKEEKQQLRSQLQQVAEPASHMPNEEVALDSDVSAEEPAHEEPRGDEVALGNNVSAEESDADGPATSAAPSLTATFENPPCQVCCARDHHLKLCVLQEKERFINQVEANKDEQIAQLQKTFNEYEQELCHARSEYDKLHDASKQSLSAHAYLWSLYTQLEKKYEGHHGDTSQRCRLCAHTSVATSSTHTTQQLLSPASKPAPILKPQLQPGT